MAKKPSLGRQKIKIEKIENNNHLQVTFSKRRLGLFKKASELVTLCGVEICIIVSSPGGKIFSFGHPNIEVIFNRFLNHPSVTPNFSLDGCADLTQTKDGLRMLGLELEQVLNELEAEKKRGAILDKIRKDGVESCWWRAPLDKLCLNELRQVKVLMEELKKNVINEANGYLVEGLKAESDFSASFSSYDGKLPCQVLYFSENSNDSIGYGQGFCNFFGVPLSRC